MQLCISLVLIVVVDACGGVPIGLNAAPEIDDADAKEKHSCDEGNNVVDTSSHIADSGTADENEDAKSRSPESENPLDLL